MNFLFQSSIFSLAFMKFLMEKNRAILEKAFTGVMISVILYVIGSGLIEVLCSPIVEAYLFENKKNNEPFFTLPLSS